MLSSLIVYSYEVKRMHEKWDEETVRSYDETNVDDIFV